MQSEWVGKKNYMHNSSVILTKWLLVINGTLLKTTHTYTSAGLASTTSNPYKPQPSLLGLETQPALELVLAVTPRDGYKSCVIYQVPLASLLGGYISIGSDSRKHLANPTNLPQMPGNGIMHGWKNPHRRKASYRCFLCMKHHIHLKRSVQFLVCIKMKDRKAGILWEALKSKENMNMQLYVNIVVAVVESLGVYNSLYKLSMVLLAPIVLGERSATVSFITQIFQKFTILKTLAKLSGDYSATIMRCLT